MRIILITSLLFIMFSCSPEWSEVEYRVDTSKERFEVVYLNVNEDLDTIVRLTDSFSDKFWLEKGSDVFIKVIPDQDTTLVDISVFWDDEELISKSALVDSAQVVQIETTAE